MFVTPVTESGILCHKKINFMLPSGSPKYKGLALCQWRLVAHHGDVRKSNLISIWQLYFYTDLLQLVPSPPLQPVARASQWLFRWKTWWKSHHSWVCLAGPWRCRLAECRAPGRRVPSTHFLSGLQPGQREQRCTHATGREKRQGQKKQRTLVLLFPGGYIFPVYCFSKKPVNCHCQLFIWLFSPTTTMTLHMPDTGTVL